MLPTAQFGRTGHDSTRVIFGAAGLGGASQDTADRILAEVEAAGINHIDTAAAYGESEVRLQPWLANHRHEVFLATKTGDREGDAARASLERSLERMGVDHVDLIQLHNLVEQDEWEVAHGPGGAVEALARARDEGPDPVHRRHRPRPPHRPHAPTVVGAVPVRLGAPADQLHAARRPRHTAADVEELLEICARDGVAVQAIKAIARRRWSDDAADPRFSWYEPLADAAAIGRAVRYVLSDPRLFLITSSDYRQLPATVEAASGPLDRPSDDELAADVEAHEIAPIFDGETLERI